MRLPRGYLTGTEAVDVARLTGLKLSTVHYRLTDAPDIDPAALVRYRHEDMLLDLSRLSWWDRLRVAWARIGAHYFLATNP